MQTSYTCPENDAIVCFELPCDPRTLALLWSESIELNCPVCHELHAMGYREMYVTGIMTQLHCVPADVQRAPVH